MLLWTLFFIVRIGVPYLSAASIGSSTNVIHAIPEIDRADFIMYELMEAAHKADRTDIWFKSAALNVGELNKTLHEKFKHINVPKDFSTKLLNWVEAERESFPQEHYSHNASACFPAGCVDPGDIGNVCCPF